MKDAQLKPCKHTKFPEGYIQWHWWAEKKSKTHYQIKCSSCDLYAIWVKRRVNEFKEITDVNGNRKTITVGDKVRYIPLHARNCLDPRSHQDCEVGVITSFNDKNVFVRYEKQHPSSNGQATNPDDLEFY